MTYTSKFYGSEPDWKQELRDVMTGAGIFGLNGASWTIVISDERMKELEQMMEQDQPVKEGAE